MSNPPPTLQDNEASEAARLRDVYALKLLDTQREERFDRYAELLVDLFGVPVAFISLVDRDRQWFKAIHGADVRELDRKQSFCAHTISSGQTTIVEDLSRDPRFTANPLVNDERGLRFYAGVPTHGPAGYPVGTIGLLDFVPRSLDARQQRQLERVGALVDQELLHGHQVDELRQELRRTAYYDSLTGLPNQRLLTDRLEFAIELALQQRKRVFYALLDVQNFGAVNQAHGWQTGNELLRAVGQRLVASHIKPRVVAHWHDDQFGVLCPMEGSAADAGQFATDLIKSFDSAFVLRGQAIYLSVRAGISVAPDHGRDALALIRCAHSAMRAASHDGKSSYRVYSPDLEQVAARQQGLGDRLRSGLQRGEISLAYQPLLDLHRHCYNSAEALLRWDDTELGYVPPEELIAVAHCVGLQQELELAVLRRACADAVNWQTRGCRVPVAVNFTAIQLHKDDLIEQVNKALADTGLEACQLILEVTEQSMVVDLESAVANMRALSATGVRFAIDDFGTGYSCFAYLADLPVHALKIDRQFTAGLGRGNKPARVVTGIIQLAHALRLKVIAEGVESRDQIDFLRGANCDEAQGFFLSHPVPADMLPAAIDTLC